MTDDELLAALAPEFWQRIDCSGECWEWKPAKPGAYGTFHGFAAHRFAYTLIFGSIPPEMFVCHECDNPRCVNPAHLWAGTYQDNWDDCRSKWRHSHGTVHPKSKFTPETVREARQLHRDGATYGDIARLYGVTHGSARDMLRGHTWKCVQ